eukprot:scaffold80120_cov63-Cyclotella_meneghiniana.AAC.2
MSSGWRSARWILASDNGEPPNDLSQHQPHGEYSTELINTGNTFTETNYSEEISFPSPKHMGRPTTRPHLHY